MKIRLSTDLLTGVLFIALGTFVIIYGSRYALGTAARMGPGYYPLLVSSGLVLIGLVLLVRSILYRNRSDELGEIDLRPLFFVLAGTYAFGALIDRIGLLISSLALVYAARLAERQFHFIEVSILAIVLVAFVSAIFLYGLGLPLRLIRF